MIKNEEFSPLCMANANYNWENVKTPITREQLTKWVQSLRSGSFDRGKNGLSDIRGFCCLGVLAAVEDKLVNTHFCPTSGEIGSFNYLNSWNGDKKYHYYLPQFMQEILGTLNDYKGFTFHDIASYLEQQFGIAQ